MKLTHATQYWPLEYPFQIAGRRWTEVPVLVVTLAEDGRFGCAETYGIDYRDETPAGMAAEIEKVGSALAGGLDREDLLHLLPAGGARNGLDCALWDLEAKKAEKPVWALAGLAEPRPLLTAFTIGAADPEVMAARAIAQNQARALKLKLTGEEMDAERVRAVRRARPDAALYVDANQSLDRASLDRLVPALVDTKVVLLEQPLPAGRDRDLDGWDAPVRLAADESVHDLEDLPGLVGLYHVANIKLDKCGGLTRALEIARAAERLGLDIMVGNMLGTSLGMAPAFILGQCADMVDLDGPTLLARDRSPGAIYADGKIHCPPQLWGGGA